MHLLKKQNEVSLCLKIEKISEKNLSKGKQNGFSYSSSLVLILNLLHFEKFFVVFHRFASRVSVS